MLLVFLGNLKESVPHNILHNVSLLEGIVVVEVLLELEDNLKPSDPHYTYSALFLEEVIFVGMKKIVLGQAQVT